MNYRQHLISSFSRTDQGLLLLLLGMGSCTEISHRYHYRAADRFHISEYELYSFLVLVLVVINPKGIRLATFLTVSLLLFSSTRKMILFHVSEGLLLQHLFPFSTMDSGIQFLMHTVLYLFLIFKIGCRKQSQTPRT